MLSASCTEPRSLESGCDEVRLALQAVRQAHPDCDEEKARGLIEQVQGRDYNPPKRERLLEWMKQQEFPICPNPDDPGACNVYQHLNFPNEIYEHISGYHEQKAAS